METAREIRAQLGHPVVDCDGHMLEFMPAALPYLREALGPRLFDQFTQQGTELERSYGGGGTGERRRTRAPQGAWWATLAKNTLDRATASTPRLLYDRLDELGMDFVVLYATRAMGTAGIADEELRRGLCRGFNEFFAAVYAPYRDRIAPAGMIPMHTPEEAIAELEHCHALGLKVVTIPHGVLRPIPEPSQFPSPYLWPGQTQWCDTFGLDAAYDYDPVWQRHLDLGYAVTAHGGMTLPVGVYSSISSFTFNHLGSFAAMMYPLAKSLFLGGVPRRFPQLPIAFLECGVSWACSLLHDLVEHWEKRNLESIQWTRPANLDVAELERLMRKHAGDFPELEDHLGKLLPELAAVRQSVPDQVDEWAHTGVGKPEDIRDQFVPSYFFGCEADDNTAAFAFSPANQFGARLQAVFSSDIGHWDVKNMAGVVPDVWSHVAQGRMSEQDLRDLVFAHPVRLFTRTNPSFFDGSPLESEARALLAG